MPDRRKTPPMGYPKITSDEDRALAELQRRRDRASSKSDATTTAPMSAPERVDDEVTSPFELIDLARYHDDPEYRRDWDEVMRQFNENAAYRLLWERSGRMKRVSDQATLVANASLSTHEDAKKLVDASEQIMAMQKELNEITTVHKIMKWILGLVIATTLGSIIVIVTKVFDWGMNTQKVEDRLQRLEDRTKHLEVEKRP